MKKIATLFMATVVASACFAANEKKSADTKLFKGEKSVEFSMQKDLAQGEWIGGISINPKDYLVAAGYNKVLVFSPKGEKVAEFKTEIAASSCCTDSKGNIYVGSRAPRGKQTFVYKYSPKGEFITKWNKIDGENVLNSATGMESHGNFIYVADTRRQCIFKFSLDGKYLGTVGKQGDRAKRKRGEFATCCGILDFGINPSNGDIHVANLGRHNVMSTSNEGKSFKKWGKRGNKVEEFCGCCNPTNLTVTQNGYIVTSEKTIPRIKVYDQKGAKMLSIMGTDVFDRGCGNLDITVDSKCNIYAIDSKKKCIRKFSPATKTSK